MSELKTPTLAARCGGPLAIVAFAALHAADAHAGDDTRACARAAYEGQQQRDVGTLAAARAAFLRCVAPDCPDLIVKDCSTWLAQVEARMPSVVLAASDGAGHDLLDVRVTMDGKPFATRLDGKSAMVDPGPHVFRFEGPHGELAETSIVAREGEKGRIVGVTLAPVQVARAPSSPPSSLAPVQVAQAHSSPPSSLASPESPPPRSVATAERPVTADTAGPGVPLGAVLLGGAGVLALGSFAFFGITGQNDKNTLSDTCAKTSSCSADAVAAARTKLIVADVSLGAGIVAIGVAAYWALSHRAPPAPNATGVGIGRGAQLDVLPMAGGMAWAVSRPF